MRLLKTLVFGFSMVNLLEAITFYFIKSEPYQLGCFGNYSLVEEYYLFPLMERPMFFVFCSLFVMFALLVFESIKFNFLSKGKYL